MTCSFRTDRYEWQNNLSTELSAAFRTENRCARNNRIAGRTIQVTCFIQVKQRFTGEDGAAVPAISFAGATGAPAYPADSDLLHYFRTKAKMLHGCQIFQTRRLLIVHSLTLPSYRSKDPHWGQNLFVSEIFFPHRGQ